MNAHDIQICTGSTIENAALFAGPLTETMDRFHINTVRRQAAFLATIATESWNLSKTEEDLYYKSAARLASIYKRQFKTAEDAEPYVRNPADLGDLLYSGYWGRGLIQLTWLKNYEKAGEALGYDYAGHPTMVKEPLHAALTAGWYWDANNCNAPADRGDMRGVTLKVNGPALMHLAERTAQYAKNVGALS